MIVLGRHVPPRVATRRLLSECGLITIVIFLGLAASELAGSGCSCRVGADGCRIVGAGADAGPQ